MATNTVKCHVRGCKSELGGSADVYFHKLRKTEPEHVKEKWRKFCNSASCKVLPSVCSKHFREKDYLTSEAYRKYYPNARAKLKSGVVPSILENVPAKRSILRRRFEMKKIVEDLLNDSEDDDGMCEMQASVNEMEQILIAHDMKPEVGDESDSESSDEQNMPENVHLEVEMAQETARNPLESDKSQLIEEIAELRAEMQRLNKDRLSLRKQISILSASNEQLRKIRAEKESMDEALRETFSKNELDLLLRRKSHVVWRRQEVQEAFVMRFLSKSCYKYLRTKKRYPLPSVAVIRKCVNRYGVKVEALNDIELESD
ncbi:uncharacterized protein LOC132256343 [Phlebotomus argentipes]|uniref:uncharacterized protein LOC132256343 n=1 Tax=Phlebotomus argentipes TaxID=94469 RepID=UPI002893583E|nr:uncharacterized protein LOC132256343 [Phlebotomus argentipes]